MSKSLAYYIVPVFVCPDDAAMALVQIAENLGNN